MKLRLVKRNKAAQASKWVKEESNSARKSYISVFFLIESEQKLQGSKLSKYALFVSVKLVLNSNICLLTDSEHKFYEWDDNIH